MNEYRVLFVLQLLAVAYPGSLGKTRIEDAFPLFCVQMSAFAISPGLLTGTVSLVITVRDEEGSAELVAAFYESGEFHTLNEHPLQTASSRRDGRENVGF
jgi:hypothetical protein